MLCVSIGTTASGYLGILLTPRLFCFLHIHYEKLGLQDILSIAFGLLTFFGILCCILFSTIYLLKIIVAVHTMSNK
jgi:hypothetical protein